MRFNPVSKITQLNKRYNYWRSGVEYNPAGVDVFAEDWDNLIILDACRYDVFEQYHPFDGRLESRTSRGSTTKEFVRANFRDKTLLDTVYVSDNGWYGMLREELNSTLFEFHHCERDAFDGAVSDPETVTETAIKFAREFEDKRLIVHYLQPHDPYFDRDGAEQFALESVNPRELSQMGYAREDIREAYVDNFYYVTDAVTDLLDELAGKTVITADHGELLGERTAPIPVRAYEHPEGNYVEELVKVPWFVVESETRKSITAGEQSAAPATEAPDERSITDQLEKLGYL